MNVRISGFIGLERVHEGNQSVVFRGRRASDDSPVFLKLLQGPYPSPAAVARFATELHLTRVVQGAGVIRLLGEGAHDGCPYLVLEDFGATSLARLFQDVRAGRKQALTLMIAAAEALARVHGLRVIHKDVNPANLVFDPVSGSLKLIDFGISSTISHERPSLRNPGVLEGTLPYLAPEQTGRMNRSLDLRSDLYSLGATFYWLLTGRPPFLATAPLELVHAHVALLPTPPHELDPDVGPDLSDVVMKLLAKNAEDRYQTAGGLRMDLEACRNDRPFVLGQGDWSDRLRIPEKLYGREEQVSVLVGAVERARQGAREVVTVTGPAGIGKTSVVAETHRVLGDGTFLAGKFDLCRRGTPYASLGAAFGEHVASVLTGTDEEIHAWRLRVLGAIGTNGQLLTTLIPGLELALGPQPPVPPAPSAESELRLHLLFGTFVRSLIEPGRPFVLFLDDLQWADLASVRLLQHLASDPASHHLLLLLAWREGSGTEPGIEPAHPLHAALDAIHRARTPVRSVRLAPLGLLQLWELLADTFSVRTDDVARFGALVLEKTQGNPFFVRRFLANLADQGWLRFDSRRRRWVWDLGAVRQEEVTDNVVALLTSRIDRLLPEGQTALSVAALLGGTFDLEDLAATLDQDPADTEENLREALEEELLDHLPAPTAAELGIGRGRTSEFPRVANARTRRYRFSHDRVHQAAASRITDASGLHLRIAKMLLAQGAGEQRLFELVEHLDEAIDLLDADLAAVALRLNRVAGVRARHSAAYTHALRLLQVAVRLAGPNVWEEQPELAFDLHLEAADAAWLATDFAEADRLLDAARKHSQTAVQALRTCDVAQRSLIARNQLASAIGTGLDALRRVGVDLPADPDLPTIGAAVGQTAAALANVDLAVVVGGPAATDPVHLARMRLLTSLASPAYFVAPMLLPLLACELVNGALTAGPTAESAYGFSLYGLVLGSVGNLASGYQMGRLALQLAQRFPDPGLRARAGHVHYGFCAHFCEPYRELLVPYAALFEEATSIGELEYAGFIAVQVSLVRFHAGKPLPVLEGEMARYADALRAIRHQPALLIHGIFHQATLNLQRGDGPPWRLVGSEYDEDEAIAQATAANDATTLFVLYGTKAQIALWCGALDEARAFADVVLRNAHGAPATTHIPLFAFTEGLLEVSRYERDGAPEMLAQARKRRDELALFAAAGPANCAHKLALLDAEIARVTNEPALTPYLDAIRGARDEGFVHEAALANQRLADFYAQNGDAVASRARIAEARHLWETWGAQAVVERLDARYGRTRAVPTNATTQTVTTTTTDIDLGAMLSATQAIAKQIVLPQLVETLMRIALTVSVARKAVLLMPRFDHLQVVAEGIADREITVTPIDHPPEGRCPLSVVAYVQRTRQPVVLHDAVNEGLFTQDPYVRSRSVRSLLCAPLEHQGKLSGILYLDNELTPGVFSPERLQLYGMLLSQAAISIENATLYNELERKVDERTRELADARRLADAEREKSDRLLLDVLPRTIAEELKATGSARPVHHLSASVLFTDFAGFTVHAARVPPETLVAQLEECFSAFDNVLDHHRLEKLKTIGDGFMGAGGLPVSNTTHPVDCVLAALELLEVAAHSPLPPLRVGVHTGPLVAGIIGKRRFTYDIWGDTVNVASRMESAGEPGRVNISAATWVHVRDLFVCRPRGHLPVKGKGAVEMYFVEGIRPELMTHGQPNERFWHVFASNRAGGPE